MIKSLTVWWDAGPSVGGQAASRVGQLRLDANGDLAFQYDPAWLADPAKPAVSFSLPKRAEPFDRRATRPFFAGLLPDEGQREAVAQALGISRTNDFRLLEALGGDVAGALTLWPEGETPPVAKGLMVAEVLDDAALVEVIDTLPRRPLLAGREGLRLSLAGAQKKLPVVLVNGRVALPAAGQPTTHILKPPIERYPATIENEAFAMRLAAAVGLPAAPVEARRVAGRGFLLVERYDRETDAEGDVRRLHQEDFCQALGIAPENKYAGEGRPTFATSFDLVRRACARPALSVLRLLDAAIFNVVIGNADAHGKNFSLLYRHDGIELAPLYDLMCTAAHPNVSPNLAMKVTRRASLETFLPGTWDRFAADIGMAAAFVRRRVRELAAAAADHAPAVAATVAQTGFDAGALDAYGALVTNRAGRILPTR